MKGVNGGLNESPSEKEGKSRPPLLTIPRPPGLNESPSEKEGKSEALSRVADELRDASMKALPKRKGNAGPLVGRRFGW